MDFDFRGAAFFAFFFGGPEPDEAGGDAAAPRNDGRKDTQAEGAPGGDSGDRRASDRAPLPLPPPAATRRADVGGRCFDSVASRRFWSTAPDVGAGDRARRPELGAHREGLQEGSVRTRRAPPPRETRRGGFAISARSRTAAGLEPLVALAPTRRGTGSTGTVSRAKRPRRRPL